MNNQLTITKKTISYASDSNIKYRHKNTLNSLKFAETVTKESMINEINLENMQNMLLSRLTSQALKNNIYELVESTGEDGFASTLDLYLEMQPKEQREGMTNLFEVAIEIIKKTKTNPMNIIANRDYIQALYTILDDLVKIFYNAGKQKNTQQAKKKRKRKKRKKCNKQKQIVKQDTIQDKEIQNKLETKSTDPSKIKVNSTTQSKSKRRKKKKTGPQKNK